MSSSRRLQETETQVLAEDLRRVIGNFVRSARAETNTPSSAQSDTLGLLDREGALSITALAQQRHVKHQSMRLVVAHLKSQGLVTSVRDPSDGRGTLIGLTDAGREALARARNARTQWIAEALQKSLTAKDRDHLRATIDILERVMTHKADQG